MFIRGITFIEQISNISELVDVRIQHENVLKFQSKRVGVLMTSTKNTNI